MKVIVVGGGVIGLSCAWRLATRGAAVELMEARRCGGGATLAALGALWPASPLHRGPLQELQRASLWRFEGFVRELEHLGGRTLGFVRGGRVELLDAAAMARSYEEAAAANEGWPYLGQRGAAMQVMTREEVVAEEPALRGGNIGRMAGAVLCRVTAQVRMDDLVAALAGACVRAGVLIHEGRAVEDVAAGAVRLGGERVNAEAVLVTAGAWTARLAPELESRARIRPAKGQGLALRRPADMALTRIIKSGKIYLVPWENEILVGSTTEPEAGFDETPSEAGRRFLVEGAAELAPALRDAEVVRHWAGLRPMGPGKGHPPVMGPVADMRGVYVCAGHYKTGVGLAPVVSDLMARLILEGTTAEELLPFLPG